MTWVLKKSLRMAGNFYWRVFGGIFISVIWLVIGIVLMFSVVGFPLSLQCFRIGWLVYKPFGKNVALIVNRPLASFLWLITFGWMIGTLCLVNALVSCATLIGFPLAGQWFKVCRLAFFPFCAVWK